MTTHAHFFIVLLKPIYLKAGSKILLVGVSSSIAPDAVDPALHLKMKWLNRTGGDPDTGFDKLCYACVQFQQTLEVFESDDFPLAMRAEYRGKKISHEHFQTL